ncbi:MAG: helix-turn-helix transcriptional regulator [Sedimentisphaerales bacterium]|nr:helix-turn-helix transcriptional regulator [Sedimentisphaerales bacterium]
MAQETGLSTLSLAILGLISQRPLTGYDIRKVFATTPMGHFSRSPGAIYPALRRIEKAGWVRGRAGQGKTHRERVAYEITAKGREVLKQHLLRPVTRDDVIWRMDDLMMRFAFMDSVIGCHGAVRFLQDFAAQVDAYVTVLHGYLGSVRDIMPPCGRLALEQGIQSYEMNAQWARQAIQELQSDSKQTG